VPNAPLATLGGTSQTARGRGNAPAVLPTVPFIRASAEHREPAGIDVSRLITAADQDLGVFDIPAYGYVRSVVLVVTATGGAGAGVTTAEDGPFNALKNIALTEPNGAVISQFNSGYDLFLVNKWGGYRDACGSDFRASPTFSPPLATTGNFTFMLRIPVELNLRDALGSLPNQNSAATFKLRLTQAAAATVYGATVPTTLPTLRVRAYVEAWDQPEQQTAGQQNQTTPPAMNTTGDADMPDPTTIYLDTRPLDIIERNNWKHQMFERSGFGGSIGATVPAADSPQGLDNGVFVYDFAHEFDGMIGRENRDLWLPTLGSTRLELQGQFGNAGTLTVLTNDVAIAGSVFI